MKGVRLWAVTAVLLTAAVAGAVAVGAVAMPKETSSVYRTVGVWEGKVAIFLPNRDTPEWVIDTPVATLPPEEQARLQTGIVVQNAAELAACLEDYTS